MNYSKIHNNIIHMAQNRASSRKQTNIILGYSERHHIIPKCMGGSDEISNLVFLSAREHFIIHLLLTKIYSTEKKLLFACHRLMYDKKGNRLNGKNYTALKTQITEYQKTLNKNNHEGIARGAEKKKGRTKETHSGIAAQAKELSSRSKETHEYIARHSKIMSSRTKDNHKGVAQGAEKRKGRTRDNHPGVARTSEKKNLLSVKQREIVVKMRYAEKKTIKNILEFILSTFHISIAYSTLSALLKRECKTFEKKIKISSSETITGLTKDNCEWRKRAAEKGAETRLGQTSENNERVAKMTLSKMILSKEEQSLIANETSFIQAVIIVRQYRKLEKQKPVFVPTTYSSKIPKEIKEQIIDMHSQGLLNVQIYEYVKAQNIDCHYSSISKVIRTYNPNKEPKLRRV